MPAKKQITREMILNAALQLVRRGGAQALNVKALAEELHCSTQPIYLSFDGMNALRRELAPTAVQEFERIMRANSPDGQTRLYSWAYILFAQKEPQLFRYLFMRPNAFAEMKPVLTPIIERSVDELARQYSISRAAADRLHDQLWMHAHGIAAMVATDYCSWDMEKARQMLEENAQLFIKEYEAQHVHE